MKRLLCIGMILMMGVAPAVGASGDVLDRFQEKVRRFTLDNGMTFLVVSRNRAPVASFVAFIDVGGVDEPAGQTGIAHFLEHLAFKGTPEIGTRNWKKEKRALEKVDRAYADWLQARYGPRAHPDKDAQALRRKFEALREKAGQYVVPNAYAKILERHGAESLNAGTSQDYTLYFCSLPANRVELWFNLESDRLRRPVFRQFFKEKQVVLEERRMRIESDPTGRMIEELQALAYMAHPYGMPTIGWNRDIITTTRADMRAFHDRHYHPDNMTVAVVGDVSPDRIKTLAETYFGSMTSKPTEPNYITREPDQDSERAFTRRGPNHPVYLEAYHGVDQLHKDAGSLDILADILARGRVSRLYEQLVVQEGLAQSVEVFNGFPGDRYPGLFLVHAIPRRDVSLDELSTAIPCH